MDVVDGLATVFAGIDNSPIASVEAFRQGNLGGHPMQVADQRIVLFAGVSNRGNVFARNDEHMHGSLRIDISEGIALVILIDGLGWNAAINDFAKDTAHG